MALSSGTLSDGTGYQLTSVRGDPAQGDTGLSCLRLAIVPNAGSGRGCEKPGRALNVFLLGSRNDSFLYGSVGSNAYSVVCGPREIVAISPDRHVKTLSGLRPFAVGLQITFGDFQAGCSTVTVRDRQGRVLAQQRV